MKLDVAVVGEIYIDHIFTGFPAWPQPGEESFARNYHREVGGGAANTACTLGRLDRSVALVGVAGTADAPWMEKRLKSFHVLTDNIEKTSGQTGVTTSVSFGNERTFFTYAGENCRLIDTLQSPAILSMLQSARHIHFAMPLSYDLSRTLLPQLNLAGCTTSLDVGFQRSWLTAPTAMDICRSVNYFLPNEREATLLSGNIQEFFNSASHNHWPTAIVKLGPRGAIMQHNAEYFEAAAPDIALVDTTGAGDAFDAGFIDALLDNAPPAECLRRACIAGALSTRAAGALAGLPTRKELREVYDQTYA
jgi:sugar/nucleoside kinase (ribokinase family)